MRAAVAKPPTPAPMIIMRGRCDDELPLVETTFFTTVLMEVVVMAVGYGDDTKKALAR